MHIRKCANPENKACGSPSLAYMATDVTTSMGTLPLMGIYCRQLLKQTSHSDRAWQVQADLESIRSNLLQRHGAYVNLTGDERLLQAAQPLVSDFLQAMPAQAGQDADWSSSLPRINEAITVPTQV